MCVLLPHLSISEYICLPTLTIANRHSMRRGCCSPGNSFTASPRGLTARREHSVIFSICFLSSLPPFLYPSLPSLPTPPISSPFPSSLLSLLPSLPSIHPWGLLSSLFCCCLTCTMRILTIPIFMKPFELCKCKPLLKCKGLLLSIFATIFNVSCSSLSSVL